MVDFIKFAVEALSPIALLHFPIFAMSVSPQQERYVTGSLPLAAFLCAHGYECDLIVMYGENIVFSFVESAELKHLVAGFETDCPVPIQSYIRCYRRLRSKMYSRKERGA